MFEAHSQIICTLFGVKIYFYGVILAIAISVGTLVSNFVGEKFLGLKKDTLIDLAPYLIIFGIIGARLYYCCLNSDFYLRFPTEILAIRHGGISIHGAILGGFIGLLFYAKRHKQSILKLCDATSVGLILAQSIGRWGNFFNSEAFGSPTNLPWKLYIAPQYRPIPFTDVEYFHPTFLYESVLDFILFIILFNLIKFGKTRKSGNLALIYLLMYSVIRILVETVRIDSVFYIMGIPVAIVVSIGIMTMAGIGLILNNLLPQKKVEE